ncbi:MAG: hypothetical protein QXE74_08165 [Candidatus Bathyarchaeia archaeon]
MKVKEVSRMFYEDADGRVKVKDRADAIERGLNKGVKNFKIIEETMVELTEPAAPVVKVHKGWSIIKIKTIKPPAASRPTTAQRNVFSLQRAWRTSHFRR